MRSTRAREHASLVGEAQHGMPVVIGKLPADVRNGLGLWPGNITVTSLAGAGTHLSNAVFRIDVAAPPDGIPNALLLKQCIVTSPPDRDIRALSVQEEVGHLHYFEPTSLRDAFALPVLHAGGNSDASDGVIKTMIVPFAEGDAVRSILMSTDAQSDEQFAQMSHEFLGFWGRITEYYSTAPRLEVDLSREMTRREWKSTGERLPNALRLLASELGGRQEDWLRNRLVVDGVELASFTMALNLVHHYFANEHPYAIPFHPDPTLANTIWDEKTQTLKWIDAGFDRDMPVEAALARLLKVEGSSTLESCDLGREDISVEKGSRRGDGRIVIRGYNPVFNDRVVSLQNLADGQVQLVANVLDDQDLIRRKLLADIANLVREVVLASSRSSDCSRVGNGDSKKGAVRIALRGMVEACRKTDEYLRTYAPTLDLTGSTSGIFEVFKSRQGARRASPAVV